MYHTVRIRDLEPQPAEVAPALNCKMNGLGQQSTTVPENYWAKCMNRSSDSEEYENDSIQNEYRQVYFEANGPHTHIHFDGHAILKAYLTAYNAHEDLVLSPDDIWLMIIIYYSHYVCNNAEQMRHLFVDHEGKKELVVRMNTMTADWPNFLVSMRDEIGKHTKNNIVDTLTSNFSTTGFVENLLSSACVMHTLKRYFDFTCIIGCGIRNVHFMGTLDDWKLLRKKTEQLKSFTLPSSSSSQYHDDFSTYLDGVLPILDQFIRTYQGDVDNDFWDTIFDYTKKGVIGGSGMRLQLDAVHGWFLRLCYGCHRSSPSNSVPLRDISLGAISVPVKLIDPSKGRKESSCYVVGGFHGRYSSNDGKHRPVMSLAVYEKKEETSK